MVKNHQSKKNRLEDILGEVSSLAHLVRLAAQALEDGADACAFQTLGDTIRGRLEDARCIIDKMEETQ